MTDKNQETQRKVYMIWSQCALSGKVEDGDDMRLFASRTAAEAWLVSEGVTHDEGDIWVERDPYFLGDVTTYWRITEKEVWG